MKIKEKYNEAWFLNRALNSIKKIKDGVWDYSDSLLIYISSGAEVYESLQEINTPYFKLVTKPEHEYLKAIAKDIADILPAHFDYIDLGPGTEHKEQFLFDELKKQGKTFTYIPVDISDHFLDLAESHAVNQDIPVKKIKSSFEELPALLGKASTPRFVSLGLTFSNYNPEEAILLLKAIAGENGFVFINTQIRNRTDMGALQKVYQDDAVEMANEKMKLIGLDPLHDITLRITDDGFRVYCTILKNNKALQGLGVKEGDKLVIFQSLRYTKNELEDVLEGEKYFLFDINSSFIGSIIKT